METTTTKLRRLQAWMQAAVMNHEAAGYADEMVNASARLSARQHLNIYRHSYVARLRECMQAQFTALAYALGTELFQAFADDYLVAYPSQSYTLNELGRRFPAYLQETRPDAGAEEKEEWPDFMIELAAFEFELAQVFDMVGAQEPERVHASTADEHLISHPLLHLYQHKHPVCSYYLEVTQGRAPELPMPEVSYCAVVRADYKLGLFPLAEAQYAFMQLVQQTGNVREAIPRFLEGGYTQAQFDEVWPAWKHYFTSSALLVGKSE